MPIGTLNGSLVAVIIPPVHSGKSLPNDGGQNPVLILYKNGSAEANTKLQQSALVKSNGYLAKLVFLYEIPSLFFHIECLLAEQWNRDSNTKWEFCTKKTEVRFSLCLANCLNY